LLHASCEYCGSAPTVYDSENKQCATIDRIDSKLGYLPTNVAAACLRCNRMKNDMSTTQFYLHIAKALKFRNDYYLDQTGFTWEEYYDLFGEN